MRGPIARTISLRFVVIGAVAAAFLVAALLLLFPLKVSVDGNSSYSCGSPLLSSLSARPKNHWGLDTIRFVATNPRASLNNLPGKVCADEASDRLRLGLSAGGVGCLVLFGALANRARVETRRQRQVTKADAPAVATAAPATAAPASSRFAHVPALDGMRGLAVLAVLAFHAGLSWATGGFLGVDAFFVLSGYLITSLLVTEWEARGTIALGAFWSRRARRLLPALLLVLLATAIYARYFTAPGRLSDLRGDAFATLAYVANWRFIFTRVGYFDSFAPPSPLRHMWSLAVEEQFYLIWPPVALLILTRLKSRLALFWIASGLAFLSVIAMLVLYRPNVDPTRVYYGTDTRAQTVLIGAALAALGPGASWAATPRRRRALVTIGVISAIFVAWTWYTIDGRSPFLYRGGLALIAVAVAAIIATAVATTSVLGRVLAWRPLAAVGQISYGLYLWHWPTFLVLTRSRTGLWGFELLAARLIVTFALAIVSFFLVERPIRKGAFRHGWATVTTPLAIGATVLLLLLATVRPNVPVRLFALPDRRSAGPQDVRVVAVGDSIALTLFGVPPRGIWLDNAARVGCGIISGVQRARGEPGHSCRSDPLVTWQAAIDKQNPDVVAALVGRWEVHDRRIAGHWTHVGDPGYDAYLADRLERGLAILTSRGAHVVLLTTPYFNGLERPDGGRWPEDDPSRVDRFNRIVREVASKQAGKVTVFDLNRTLSPDGHYTRHVDGFSVRSPDGNHISGDGARLVGRVLFPRLAAAGQQHRADRLARADASP